MVAPRILKDPVFCSDSTLSRRLMDGSAAAAAAAAAEARAEKKAEDMTGVALMKGAMRAWAA